MNKINLPCKDCITKVICRNELYKRIVDDIISYESLLNKITINLHMAHSIYHSLYRKCVLIHSPWDNHNVINEITEEFKIDIKQILDEQIENHKEWIKGILGENYNIVYNSEQVTITRN